MGVAWQLAEALRDHERVRAAVAAAPTQTDYPLTIHWQPSTLAQGDAGLALACAYLDTCFPNAGWDRVGHHYLSVAAEGAQLSSTLSLGLFGGLAGLALAGWSLSRDCTRYRRLLNTLDAALLPRVGMHADILTNQGSDGISFGEFDLISGLTGVGAYLLCRCDNPIVLTSLKTVLHSLIALTSEDDGRPRWWTPAHLSGDEDAAARHPFGSLNCGLAHGIPGPLALMALARSSGVAVTGLEEAIDRVAEWLVTHRADDPWGVNWPYAVSFTAEGSLDTAGAAQAPSRAAWCYGAPGVARALWLAGVARGRSEWCNLAIAAMDAVYRRPIPARSIDSPTFCHGVAGLLQVTLRFANETRLPVFAEAAADLTNSLLDAYEPDSLLGYRNWEPGGNRVDHAGLLDGAPGVLLALLAAATSAEPLWDRAFLLS
jgi:lantibiotic biosynthesis protein